MDQISKKKKIYNVLSTSMLLNCLLYYLSLYFIQNVVVVVNALINCMKTTSKWISVKMIIATVMHQYLNNPKRWDVYSRLHLLHYCFSSKYLLLNAMNDKMWRSISLQKLSMLGILFLKCHLFSLRMKYILYTTNSLVTRDVNS